MLSQVIHRTLFVVLLCAATSAVAQRNPDLVKFYMEAGLNGGGAFYLGDANAKPFSMMGPTFGAFCKYKFSGHHELGGEINGGWAGVQRIEGVQTNTSFVDVSVLYTFNFWNYGGTRYEEHASIVTPYIFAGLGFTTYRLETPRFGANIPFGFGVKVKLARRWNIGLSWTMRKFIATDDFDQQNDPFRLNAGILTGRDWLSNVGLSVSCDFLQICAPCRKLEKINRTKAKRRKKS